mgnify:CR=1 FL=1
MNYINLFGKISVIPVTNTSFGKYLSKSGVFSGQPRVLNGHSADHNVGHSERTGVMVEPYLSKQWFVNMEGLSKRVLENQKDKDNKVNFVPVRFENTLSKL